MASGSLFGRAISVYRSEGLSELVSAGVEHARIQAEHAPYRVAPHIPGYRQFVLRRAQPNLVALLEAEMSPEEVIAATDEYQGPWPLQTIQPMQHPGELRELLEVLEGDEIRRVLEIGTANGGTFFSFIRSFRPDVAISIDIGRGKYLARRPLFPTFAHGLDTRVETIVGRSQSSRTLRRLDEVAEGPIDLAFIDGDHRYEGVRADWELYREWVADDGIVLFHDIKHTHQRTGVKRLWNEIRDDYSTREIVADAAQESGGIGVLYLGSDT